MKGPNQSKIPLLPVEGKYAWSVTVGTKGQIVIPKEARELFNIRPGDSLLLLGDVERGIAIPPKETFEALTRAVFGGGPIPAGPGEFPSFPGAGQSGFPAGPGDLPSFPGAGQDGAIPAGMSEPSSISDKEQKED